MPRKQAIVFVCLFIPAIASAEIYTWIDNQGVAHFTDIKPREGDYEPVEPRRPSLIPMRENISRGERVTTINQQVERSLQASEGGKTTPSAGQQASDARKQQARCDRLRERLERIQKKLRAGYSNDQGNRLRRQRREISQRLSWECILG